MSDRQRESVFSPQFRDDLRWWVENDRNTGLNRKTALNRKTTLRILKLTEAVLRDPSKGMGKPEPLKLIGKGLWSRRVTREHRLVYSVEDDRVCFLQCRYHY